MKRLSLLMVFIAFLSFKGKCQDSLVIELDQVEIVPTDKLLIYSNFSKKHGETLTRIHGKTAVVMGFVNPEKLAIELEGLELFFNYEWAQDSSGFYVQPVVVKAEEGFPVATYTDFSEKYLVTSKLENRLYIDLSSKKISMVPRERLFIGIRFLENFNPEAHNTFNITFASGKITEYTYLLYSDGRKPQEIIGPGKQSAGMKYSVVYKLKN